MEKVDTENRVAVIIPCGGHHSKYILDALSSCLKADPPPDEVIIIDDCASPLVPDGIDKWNRTVDSPDVRLVRLDNHMGRSWARNFGVDQTDSDWLYFLDADDVLESRAIADFRKIAESNGADLIYADYDYLDRHDNRVRVSKKPFMRQSPLRHRAGKYIPRGVFYNAVNIGMFVRKDRFLAVGGFDEEMAIGEYWDFFVRYTVNPRIQVFKHDRPFFVARQQSSASPHATELMKKATRKIQAMIRGGYYQEWIKR